MWTEHYTAHGTKKWIHERELAGRNGEGFVPTGFVIHTDRERSRYKLVHGNNVRLGVFESLENAMARVEQIMETR